MSKAIIDAIRHNHQIPSTVYFTAIELAHRASDAGVVTISYSYLAQKCRKSRRTAMRHIQRLLDEGIITCQRFWKPGAMWGINRYQFVLAWKRARRYPGGSDKVASKVPPQEYCGEKFGQYGGFEQRKTKILDGLTPGSMLSKMLQGARQG